MSLSAESGKDNDLFTQTAFTSKIGGSCLCKNFNFYRIHAIFKCLICLIFIKNQIRLVYDLLLVL